MCIFYEDPLENEFYIQPISEYIIKTLVLKGLFIVAPVLKVLLSCFLFQNILYKILSNHF